ncbi:hypothetical protein ACFQH6_12075 [Halobacteriaceae archaeon GCM10025711]
MGGLAGFVLFGVVVTLPHLLAAPALEQTVAVVFTGFILPSSGFSRALELTESHAQSRSGGMMPSVDAAM